MEGTYQAKGVEGGEVLLDVMHGGHNVSGPNAQISDPN